MKEPNRPFVIILSILLGLLCISIPIMIPAFKLKIISWIDPNESLSEYAHTTYHLLWLLCYLLGTSIGVILIGFGALRILRLVKKENYRVQLD